MQDKFCQKKKKIDARQVICNGNLVCLIILNFLVCFSRHFNLYDMVSLNKFMVGSTIIVKGGSTQFPKY